MEAFVRVPSQHLDPNRPRPSFLQKMALVLRLAGLALTTLFVYFPLQALNVLRPLIGRKLLRKYFDFVQQAWFDSVFLMLHQTKLRIRSDPLKQLRSSERTRPKIILCNHVTDVDWLYLCMLSQSQRESQTGHVKVMLKEGVRKIPVYGTIMDRLDFIWLKRDWSTDQDQIAKKVRQLIEDREPLWIVLFPEGITVNTKSMEKSHDFSRKENRPFLKHTMLPRSKGLEAVLEHTKHANPEIIDVSMIFESFTGEIPTWEMGYERNHDHKVPNAKKLFAGMAGGASMELQSFCTDDLLSHPQGVQGWLDERWKVKDDLLDSYARGEVTEEGIKVMIPEGSLVRVSLLILGNAFLLKVMQTGIYAVYGAVRG